MNHATLDVPAPVAPPPVAPVPVLTRLVLVDDCPTVRRGLRAALARELDLRVVGEAADAVAALKLVERVQPDVVLLDLRLTPGPGLAGLVLCRQLSERCPRTRPLVLSTLLDHRLVAETADAGAWGYLVKGLPTAELAAAIRAVAAGRAAFDSRVEAPAVQALGDRAGPSPGRRSLTSRESDVLRLVAGGLANGAVAQELAICAGTVRIHVRNIMRKLGVGSRAEAVYAAHQRGLV